MIYLYDSRFAEISAFADIGDVSAAIRGNLGKTWHTGPSYDNMPAPYALLTDNIKRVAQECYTESELLQQIPAGCTLHLGTGYVYPIGDPNNVMLTLVNAK